MESLNKQQPPRIVQSSVIEPKDELSEVGLGEFHQLE